MTRDRIEFIMRVIRTLGAILSIVVNVLVLYKLHLIH